MKADFMEKVCLPLYDICKTSAGLPRFDVNINCEVNMNRFQTPTRKTVLVFQFFVKKFMSILLCWYLHQPDEETKIGKAREVS